MFDKLKNIKNTRDTTDSKDNFRKIPKFFVEDQLKFKDTIKNATHYNKTLYFWDSGTLANPDENNYTSKQNFISSIREGGIKNISLVPSEKTHYGNYTKGRYIKNITNYNQRENDTASLIYSQERPVYQIDSELDLGDELVWITERYVEQNGEQIDDDILVFLIDSYNPQYDEFGAFQYATLTLKRIASWKISGKNASGEEIPTQFIFNGGNVAPKNVKRLRISTKGKVVNFGLIVNNLDDGLPSDYSFTENTDGIPYYSPFLPRVDGSKISFIDLWLNEIGFINLTHSYINNSRNSGLSSGAVAGESNQKANDKGSLPNQYGDNQVGFGKEGIGAIPNQDYRYLWAGIAEVLGLGDDEQMKEQMGVGMVKALEYVSSFNSNGYTLSTTDGESVSQGAGFPLPRVYNQEQSAWKTFENETLFKFDALYGEVEASFIIGGDEIDGIVSLPKQDIGSQYETKAKEIIAGSTTIVGQDIPVFTNTTITQKDVFDISGKPSEWSKEDIAKWMGVIFVDEYPRVDGSSPYLETGSLDLSQVEQGSTFTLQAKFLIGMGKMYYEYLTNETSKGRKIGVDFYKDEGYASGETDDVNQFGRVIEIEFPNNINIQSIDWKQFGGYEYTLEWFSNSIEDSAIEGDKYCIDPDTGLQLTPSSNRAPNRRGTPYGANVNITYAVSDGARKVLNAENKRRIENNEDTLINTNTGDYVKNTIKR